MVKLILMRHGQSQWNLLNLFTGWVDVPLSTLGVKEALEGGYEIKDEPIDMIFTSTLIRAQMTAMLATSVHHTGKTPVVLHPNEDKFHGWSQIHNVLAEQHTIPVVYAWELNERMYGELQGMNKNEAVEKFGAEQVQIWRRSYDVPPPGGESLEMTAKRVIPYFENNILSALKSGKNVYVSAHGNSLRAIIMVLDQLSREEVVSLEIPTGHPIIYHFEKGKFTKQSKVK